MIERTDNELMLLVKGGDLDKMSVLFHRYHRFLYNFLYQMTYDRETSEDVVQNTFYRMLKYRHTFVNNGEFKVWMFHLGRNALKDYQKGNQRHKQDKMDAVESHASDRPLPDEQLHNQHLQRQLQAAMTLLHEDEREVLVLSKFHELRYGEIARLLNTSEGAVKVRVHRAFSRLKTICQKKGLL